MGSDNQWTALGPAIIGFQTDSASINVGADITGNEVGIRGHSDKGNGVQGTSGQGVDASDKEAGIFGAGQGYGVYGIDDNIQKTEAPEFVAVTDNTSPDYDGAIGVTGASKDRPGVIGSSEILKKDTAEYKVFDQAANENPPPPKQPSPSLTSAPVGVLGISKTSIGVFGFSFRGCKPSDILPDILPDPTPFYGTGIFGLSVDGTGVYGVSPNGIGVRGASDNDRGGWFVSKKAAQLHLEPQVANIDQLLSTPGVGGDLIAINNSDINECELYFHNGQGWTKVALTRAG